MARPRTCSVKYFCLGAFLIFLGSVLLCALGFTVVLPHEATRFWMEVTCHVTNTSYDLGHCACDQQVMEYDNCIDKYPCLRIGVIYNVSADPYRVRDDTKVKKTVTRTAENSQETYQKMFSEPEEFSVQQYTFITAMLYRKWSDSFHRNCALYECGDEIWNIKEVKRFKKEWGQEGQSYPCFFDPDNPGVAVLERTQRSHVVHAILWPALSLFIGSLIWLGMCLGCWKIEIEQPQTSSSYYRGIL